jgi:cell division protein ZapA
MKQLEVQIMGQSYLLGCPDGGDARLLEAVERVDTAMCKIREAGKVRARDRIAVLAALNLAFDLADQDTVKTQAPENTPPATQQQNTLRDDQPLDDKLMLDSLLGRLDQALGDAGESL